MLEHAARHWWTLTLRAIVAFVFAIILFVAPNVAVSLIILVFGAYAFIDGVLALIAAARFSHADENWQPLIIEGVLGILFGIVAWSATVALIVVLVYIVAAWAILSGIVEILAAVRLRRVIADEWWLVLAGILSLIFGFVLLANPTVAVVTLAYLLGIYALLFGLLLISLSMRLRGLSHSESVLK